MVLAQETENWSSNAQREWEKSHFFFPSSWRIKKGTPGIRKYWGHCKEESLWKSDLVMLFINPGLTLNGTHVILTLNSVPKALRWNYINGDRPHLHPILATRGHTCWTDLKSIAKTLKVELTLTPQPTKMWLKLAA